MFIYTVENHLYNLATGEHLYVAHAAAETTAYAAYLYLQCADRKHCLMAGTENECADELGNIMDALIAGDALYAIRTAGTPRIPPPQNGEADDITLRLSPCTACGGHVAIEQATRHYSWHGTILGVCEDCGRLQRVIIQDSQEVPHDYPA